jgi:hypothetical protein
MVDLQNITSNLLLVGFALVSICCLYLLYSNFSKVREINELKNKVEDLKNIFFNQQKHNDMAYENMLNMINNSGSNSNINNFSTPNNLAASNNISSSNVTNLTNLTNIMKKISINPDLTESELLQLSNTTGDDNTGDDNSVVNNDLKEIKLDLHELDNLDVVKDEEDIDTISNVDLNVEDLGDVDKPIEDNIYDSIHSIKKENEIFDNLTESNSITTDPVGNIEDIDNIMDGDFDENLLNNNQDENDNEINLEQPPVTQLQNTNDDHIDNLDDFDLDEFDTTKQVNIDNSITLSETLMQNKTSNSTEDVNNEIKVVLVGNNNVNNSSVDVANEITVQNNTSVLENDLSIQKAKKNKKVNESSESSESNDLNELLNGNTDVKKIEIDAKLTNINSMSIKQLKDLAKSYKVKTYGTKQELIAALSAVM